jgi:hypothetical protein
MLPLEVVGPGGSLSTLLLPRLRMSGRRHGDGSIQLRPDDCGNGISAGGWLMVATAELFQFLMAMDAKLCDFWNTVFSLFSYQELVESVILGPI